MLMFLKMKVSMPLTLLYHWCRHVHIHRYHQHIHPHPSKTHHQTWGSSPPYKRRNSCPLCYYTAHDGHTCSLCIHQYLEQIVISKPIQTGFLLKVNVDTRKFKGVISRSGHLAITYRSELLYLWIFSLLSPPSKFAQRVLPFSHGLKSCTHLGYRTVNTRQR